MPTYRAAPGTEVNGVDQAGNAWPKPLKFSEKGVLKVPDDQQDVVTALDGAAANGHIEKE
jgi:hypothetical protein